MTPGLLVPGSNPQIRSLLAPDAGSKTTAPEYSQTPPWSRGRTREHQRLEHTHVQMCEQVGENTRWKELGGEVR